MQKKIRYFLLILLIISAYTQAKQTDESGSIALIHVTVIDATGLPPQPGMTVVITGARIMDIARDDSIKLPQNIHTVDASGKFLIPGLWDMHAHLEDGAFFFPLFIANGVTSLRDMGVPKRVCE